MKKPVFRKGDVVVINDPTIVLRCGYDITFDKVFSDILYLDQNKDLRDLLANCSKEIAEKIYNLRTQVHTEHNSLPYQYIFDTENPEEIKSLAADVENRILYAITYLVKNQIGLSDRQRKLFTEKIEVLKGISCLVIGKRVVFTGTYEPASYSYSNEDEECCEPAYLGNPKAHVLLRVKVPNYNLLNFSSVNFSYVPHVFEIESCCVSHYTQEKSA